MELNKNYSLRDSNNEFLDNKLDKLFFLSASCFNLINFCKMNRPNSICYNYACVSHDFTDEFIHGDFNLQPNDQISLMSSVNGLRLNTLKNNFIKVPASTLTNILDKQVIPKIDLLSLDVEGYEYSVLKGLDLNKYKPTYMLIEVYNFDFTKICNYLKDNNYQLISNFSNYNKKNNPNWDGTHNDFLFKTVI